VETTLSSTPILDLQKPLPQPLENRVTGIAATPFLMLVGAIAMTENNSALAIPFGILAAMFLSTVVHELGHIVAGLVFGMRFRGVLIGPFVLQRSRIGWRFRLTRFWVRGHTYMSLPKVRNMRRRLFALVLGGPLSSLVCGAAALIVGEVLQARSETSWVGVLELFGVYSIFIGIIAFRPFRVGPYAGDGMLLRALTRSRADANQLIAMYALGFLRDKNPDGVGWNDRWIGVAYEGTLAPQYYRDLASYYRASDADSAATLLEKCLQGSAFLSPAGRDNLIAEVVEFASSKRSDASLAQRWLERINSLENISLLTRARMNVAFEMAADQPENALRHWQTGLELIRQSPKSPAAERYELSWHAWMEQVIQRFDPNIQTAPNPEEALANVM
jgi:peptidase M50-like protein